MTWVHLGILLVSLLGFVALALATERHAEHLLRQVPAPRWRRLARAVGWGLLAAALALGIWHLGISVGITLWVGWLCIAALALVFALPRWPWQPPARPARARKVRAGPAAERAIPPRRRRRWGAGALLAATVGVFVVALWRVDTRPLLSQDALQGTAGPWAFTLAQADRLPPRVVELDAPLKAFELRFCRGCDQHIRAAYLKVHKPRSMRATGMVFEEVNGERRVDIQLPSTLRADSELWLTVVGKDGQVHRQSWRMDQAAPATVAWFDPHRSAHGRP